MMVKLTFKALGVTAQIEDGVWTSSEERMRATLQYGWDHADHGPAAGPDPELTHAREMAERFGGRVAGMSRPRPKSERLLDGDVY